MKQFLLFLKSYYKTNDLKSNTVSISLKVIDGMKFKCILLFEVDKSTNKLRITFVSITIIYVCV